MNFPKASHSPHETFSPDVACVRYARILGTGTQLDQRRRRKPPSNPLLPLRLNRHPKRDETPTEWGIIHSSPKEALIVPALPDIT